ncbi:MAG: hypothetical protein KBS60_01305 [Phascolarctobacterium sp.]|nr:hypothetical protein [Candidatus Phascolarctobacterium caballi]
MAELRAIPKKKKIKLSVGQQIALRKAIFERDHYCCVVCGKKAQHRHHEPPGSNKTDRIETGVALCVECHNIRHNDPNRSLQWKKIIVDYLRNIYADYYKSN